MTESASKKNPEENPKKSWKKAVLTVFAVLAIIAVALLIWLFNRPAKGVVRVIEQEPTATEKESLLSAVRFDGKYATFSYPGGYAPRETDPDTVSIEKAFFVASGTSSRMLAVAVMDMRGKTLDDIPAYRLRSDVKKAQYGREKGKSADGSEVIVFTKQEEGYEKTAFILGSGFLATISVSSQSFADPERIKSDFESILGSFAFKK
jgi:hypothetical protein